MMPMTKKIDLLLNDISAEEIQTDWLEANIGGIKIADVQNSLFQLYEKLSEEIHGAIKEHKGAFIIPIDNKTWKANDIMAIVTLLKKFGLTF